MSRAFFIEPSRWHVPFFILLLLFFAQYFDSICCYLCSKPFLVVELFHCFLFPYAHCCLHSMDLYIDLFPNWLAAT